MRKRPATRRAFLGFGASLLSMSLAVPLRGQTPGISTLTLRDELEKGLKARRPEEFQFIARVVQLVAKGQLPVDLVKSTFLWARKRTRFEKYPFPFFERALRQRAAQLGISL